MNLCCDLTFPPNKPEPIRNSRSVFMEWKDLRPPLRNIHVSSRRANSLAIDWILYRCWSPMRRTRRTRRSSRWRLANRCSVQFSLGNEARLTGAGACERSARHGGQAGGPAHLQRPNREARPRPPALRYRVGAGHTGAALVSYYQ